MSDFSHEDESSESLNSVIVGEFSN